MTLGVSPQIRLVALLGGLAALGLAAFMLTLGRSSPGGATAASVGTIKPLHPVRKLGTHGTVQRAAGKAAPKSKPKPAVRRVTLLPGLPSNLAQSLRKHDLVVVGLFDPQARVDRITLAEASAAAEVTRAGFVPLNVLDQRQAGPLVRELGVLPDPAVLVYRRPGKLVARFDGFADRDTVAQAVTNAAPAELARQAAEQKAPLPAPVTLGTWAGRASAICRRAKAQAPKIHAGASKGEFLAWAPSMLATQEQLLTKLAALPLPTAPRGRVLAKRFLDAAKREHVFEKRIYLTVKRDGQSAALRLMPASERITAQVNEAAIAAGATGCAIYGQ
ncbi:MAG TPA: hypothetical protein VE596_11975 [Gaiellaceae bacterium]|nr:hypothetical protein [Gaiellaceae bacterium]